MVLYIPTDIASRPAEEVITPHYTIFDGSVAFGKFYHQFLESRALKTYFCFGKPLLDSTIIIIPCSRVRWLDLAVFDLVR